MTPRQIPVDPARLTHGQWCHKRNRQIGEGDIAASYSADRIGQSQSIRKPFRFDGESWVSVGNCGDEATAYRLGHVSQFQGDTNSYAERCRNGDAARSDDLGFYHGMEVTHRKETYVLLGPPASFVPGEPEQPSLF